MLKKCLMVIFLLLFMSMSVYAQIHIEPSSKDSYNIKIKNISLLEFVKFVSEFTGINIVYNARDLHGEISINSPSPMNRHDILQLFYTILRADNLIAVHKKDYIQILRLNSTRNYQDSFAKDVDKHKEDILTSVFCLHRLNSDIVARAFLQLKSTIGQVLPIRGLGVIVVRDLKSRIVKMSDILNELRGIAYSYKVTAIVLKNVSASEVSHDIREFYTRMYSNSLVGNVPVVIPDNYSNTLIVAATPSILLQIKNIVSNLDVPAQSVHNVPQVIYLKNADASDVAKVLQRLIPSLVKGERSKNREMMTTGSVTFDKATNAIIVIGDKKFDKEVEEFVKKLDIPRKQVFVEALILETTLNKASSFGVEWLAGGGNKNFAATTGFVYDKSLAAFQSSVLSGNPPDFNRLPGGFNLGILGNVITYEGVKFPTLGSLVNALKNASGINILSNPQILTLNNQKAEIFVGENRPFLTSEKYDANNNPIQTFDYRDVGVRLRITPHISSDNTITLKIYQEVKKVVANASVDLPLPITLTRTTNTVVKLKDGATMVISGLIKNDTSLTRSAVPFLSKIPIIGWLMRYKQDSGEKTNLMIFISAHVIKTANEARSLTKKKQERFKKFRRHIEKKMSTEY